MKLATVGAGKAVHIARIEEFSEATLSDGRVIPARTRRDTACGAAENNGNALYGHRRNKVNDFEGELSEVTCKRCMKSVEFLEAQSEEASVQLGHAMAEAVGGTLGTVTRNGEVLYTPEPEQAPAPKKSRAAAWAEIDALSRAVDPEPAEQDEPADQTVQSAVDQAGGNWDKGYNTLDAPAGRNWTATGCHSIVIPKGDTRPVDQQRADILGSISLGTEPCSLSFCDICAEQAEPAPAPAGDLEHMSILDLAYELQSLVIKENDPATLGRDAKLIAARRRLVTNSLARLSGWAMGSGHGTLAAIGKRAE